MNLNDATKEDTIYRLYRLGIFLLFINSMYPWPMWSWKVPVFPIISFLLTIPIFSKRELFSSSSKSVPILIGACIVYFVWTFRYLTFFGIIGQFFIVVPTISVITLKNQYKTDLIEFVTKWFAILLSVSLLFFLLKQIGVGLPNNIITHPGYDCFYYNYYFFVEREFSIRFNSIFLEPGHLTMGLAPLLFINKYNLRNKYVLILFIAQLFSLSLAGIIVMAAGLIFQVFTSKSFISGLSRLFIIAGFIFLVGYGLSNLFPDDNIVQTFVINRIERGSDSMDDRSDESTSYMYKMLLKSDDVFLGKPELRGQLVGAGYKNFILLNGFFGCFLVLIFYFIPVLMYNKRIVFLFYILLIMLFAQDAYPDWFCVLFCSIAGSEYLYSYQETHNHKAIKRNEKRTLLPSNK